MLRLSPIQQLSSIVRRVNVEHDHNLLFDVHTIVMLTNESRSKSTRARISDDKVSASLDYMYLNRPDSRFEHRSRTMMHSTSLDIIGRPAIRLKGRYWTNRDSKSELVFCERTIKFADDFLQAETFFNSSN